eukprot:TRINITY_DN170_c0_g1_i1.p2 TRINITY_DN170_c0_g1~~TRINITY_DN170_c0_g1_i1.p2  ORF type:complete len:227 (+),score=81.99 TRINITY_DN170_c0_g1_i1:146-826(+)
MKGFLENKAGLHSVDAGDFHMSIEVENEPMEIFVLNDYPNVVPKVGSEFAVRFQNDGDEDVLVNLSIDGTSVLGEGWDSIVKAKGELLSRGYSKGNGKCAAFLFAKLDKEAGPYTPQDAKRMPDSRVGLIACKVFACRKGGVIPNVSALGNTPNVVKDNTQISKNKKKANVIAGTGHEFRDQSGISKVAYEKLEMIASMEVRYNSIGEAIPTAEMDQDFMKEVDYE